jgi:hypothetical protein
MWLNMFIPAVIGIISFSLAVFPSYSIYYQIPMGIIGKVYATSMLVLINSRMVLGSEEVQTASRVISVLRFAPAPANSKDSAVEAENGDVAVYSRSGEGPSGSSEPAEV